MERKISVMPFSPDVLPFDLDQVADHGKYQVWQPQRNDHPVDGIDPVVPIDKVEINLEILFPVPLLIGFEQPPSAKIVSDNQYADQKSVKC